MSIEQEKKLLRELIKLSKAKMTNAQKKVEVISVFKQIESLPAFTNASHVLCYWSLPDELDTYAFLERWFRKKHLYLPRVVGDAVEIVPYQGIDSMQKGAYGILEPTGNAICNLLGITFAIIPGISFSLDGYRLGRGGGYYDKLLPCLKNAFHVGVGYSCQIVEEVPVEEHDVRLDLVIFQNKKPHLPGK